MRFSFLSFVVVFKKSGDDDGFEYAVVKDFGSAIEYNNEWGAKARLENVKAARYDSMVVGRNKKRKMAYVFVDKDTILR